MLPERLPMIAGHHDEGLIQHPSLRQQREQLPEASVGVRDLAVVRALRAELLKLLGRVIVRVWVEVVHPQEPALVRAGLQELASAPRGVLCRRLTEHEHRCLRRVRQVIVIDVKALIEAEAAVQDEGGDHRARREAVLGEDLCQGDGLFRHIVGPVVPRAVAEGLVSREDRGV